MEKLVNIGEKTNIIENLIRALAYLIITLKFKNLKIIKKIIIK